MVDPALLFFRGFAKNVEITSPPGLKCSVGKENNNTYLLIDRVCPDASGCAASR